MRPVVLVHGLFASPLVMMPMRTMLRSRGLDVWLAPGLGRGVAGDVRTHAARLDDVVEQVLARTGADSVDVVGASQGGIIALWWAHAHDGWRRTGRLVTVGTPFKGADLARHSSPLIGWMSEGVRQLSPGSPFLAALGAVPLKRPVVSIAAEGDPVCPPTRCGLSGMQRVVVRGRAGWFTHQMLMLDERVADAIHQALRPTEP